MTSPIQDLCTIQSQKLQWEPFSPLLERTVVGSAPATSSARRGLDYLGPRGEEKEGGKKASTLTIVNIVGILIFEIFPLPDAYSRFPHRNRFPQRTRFEELREGISESNRGAHIPSIDILTDPPDPAYFMLFSLVRAKPSQCGHVP